MERLTGHNGVTGTSCVLSRKSRLLFVSGVVPDADIVAGLGEGAPGDVEPGGGS